MLVVIDDPADKLSGGQIATPVFANLIDKVLVRQGVVKNRMRTADPLRRADAKIVVNADAVPDFRGRGLAESLAALVEMRKRRDITYSIQGAGKVYAQEPAPGARLEKAAEIKLFLKD